MTGLTLEKFIHNSFLSGENKGDPPSVVRSTELDRVLNAELRGKGLATRLGSNILTVTAGLPAPISGNPSIKSIHGHQVSSGTYDTFFNAGTVLYRDPITPVSLKTGLGDSEIFSYASESTRLYMVNVTDPVQFYDPDRSTSQTYDAGYDTMDYSGPPAMSAASSTTGGGLTGGATYEYHVIFYDLNTYTKANAPSTSLSITLGGADDTVTISNLPIDSNSRTTHWEIYRKGPNDYYFYFLDRVTYNAGSPTYVDTSSDTGRTRVLETDNYAPDTETVGLALITRQRTMVYFYGNTFQWSKAFRYQNVPTYNRDSLDDSAESIIAAVEFKESIIFFKESSIYVLIGSLFGEYTISKFSKSIGTLSPKSIAVDTDGIFFYDSNNRPRYISSSDFDANDLRMSSDISYKYRAKFEEIPRGYRPYVFGYLWKNGSVEQYRLHVPLETTDYTCDHCFIYDIGVAARNNGDSPWFDFRYNGNYTCATVVNNNSTGYQIHSGDNYGLIHRLDIQSTYYDGNDYYTREEDEGTVTYGTDTIAISPSPVWTVNQWVGHLVLLYDSYTFTEIYRGRIKSNTADTITLVENLPSLSTTNPFLTIGGYLSYFGTSWFSRNFSGKSVPEKIFLSFDRQYSATDLNVFVNFDFNLDFNYNYAYINDSTKESKTPLSDIYLIALSSIAYYDISMYGACSYGQTTYENVDFLLRSYYYFSHVSWGCITRKPDNPFGYISGTLYYYSKGDLL